MLRIVPRHLGVLTALLVVITGLCARAQAPIVEEPNYKPTLTFDIVSIRLAPPPDAQSPEPPRVPLSFHTSSGM